MVKNKFLINLTNYPKVKILANFYFNPDILSFFKFCLDWRSSCGTPVKAKWRFKSKSWSRCDRMPLSQLPLWSALLRSSSRGLSSLGLVWNLQEYWAVCRSVCAWVWVCLQVWPPGVSVPPWISLTVFPFFLGSFLICFTVYPFCVTVDTWHCLGWWCYSRENSSKDSVTLLSSFMGN